MASPRVLSPLPSRVHARGNDENVSNDPGASVSGTLNRSLPPRPAIERQRTIAWAGAIACAAYLLQTVLGFAWGPLAGWQSGFWYKLGTGSLLAVFVGGQWLLAFCRWRAWNRIAKPLYLWHQRLGVLGPVLLFAHSMTLGYGYLLMLSGVFLADTALGVLSPQAFPALRKHQTPWMASHIALSLLLVSLVAYHVWTALYFE